MLHCWVLGWLLGWGNLVVLLAWGSLLLLQWQGLQLLWGLELLLRWGALLLLLLALLLLGWGACWKSGWEAPRAADWVELLLVHHHLLLLLALGGDHCQHNICGTSREDSNFFNVGVLPIPTERCYTKPFHGGHEGQAGYGPPSQARVPLGLVEKVPQAGGYLFAKVVVAFIPSIRVLNSRYAEAQV